MSTLTEPRKDESTPSAESLEAQQVVGNCPKCGGSRWRFPVESLMVFDSTSGTITPDLDYSEAVNDLGGLFCTSCGSAHSADRNDSKEAKDIEARADLWEVIEDAFITYGDTTP